jgi:hypothetical protein
MSLCARTNSCVLPTWFPIMHALHEFCRHPELFPYSSFLLLQQIFTSHTGPIHFLSDTLYIPIPIALPPTLTFPCCSCTVPHPFSPEIMGICITKHILSLSCTYPTFRSELGIIKLKSRIVPVYIFYTS